MHEYQATGVAIARNGYSITNSFKKGKRYERRCTQHFSDNLPLLSAEQPQKDASPYNPSSALEKIAITGQNNLYNCPAGSPAYKSFLLFHP